MSALPAPTASGEYRALTLYDAIPEGCGTVLVPDDKFAPHLKAGELAVIDADDREPARGEIYVVKITSTREPCGYVLRVVQIWSRIYDFAVEDGKGGRRSDPDIGWMMHFQIIQHRPHPLTVAEVANELRAGTISLCDGPLYTDGMRHYIVGRVVGVVDPAVALGNAA